MAIPINQVLSHWAQSFLNFNISAATFYSACENSLKEHQLPDVSISRVKNKEGGIFSASREYLRVKKGDLAFDICASPFGKTFFISWWLYETSGKMRQMFKSTKLGDVLESHASNKTIYQIDEEIMFRTIVHEVLMGVLDGILQEKVNRKLSDTERLIPQELAY